MPKILLIDDDKLLLETLSDALAVEGHQIECAETGEEGLSRLRNYEYDLVILDWNLPDTVGPDLCARFREMGGATPVLMLTANTSVNERADGLDAGADDYLGKPFALKELHARVRALVRRGAGATSNVLRSGDVELDLKRRKVSRGGQEIQLLAKEFALLEYFFLHRGQTLSINDLLAGVWGFDSDATEDACRQCIARLRKKIDAGRDQSLIRTMVGLGYVLD